MIFYDQETAREVRSELEATKNLWTYQGNPDASKPHALLTSGLHSDGFANVGAFLKDHPDKRRRCAQLLLALYTRLFHLFHYTVGADTSSTELAKDLAIRGHARHIKMQKQDDANGKRQLWLPENRPLVDGDEILQVEELITTAVSAIAVREGIRLANPGVKFKFSPFLLTVVDRSDPERRIEKVEDSRIIFLLRLDIRNYKPEDCPYCKAGSQAIKPKEGDNWSLLTGSS